MGDNLYWAEVDLSKEDKPAGRIMVAKQIAQYKTIATRTNERSIYVRTVLGTMVKSQLTFVQIFTFFAIFSDLVSSVTSTAESFS